ncbi:MAG: hypothetical protein LBF32_01645, partial [Streptococcaceae bacterium]|nr:hypothetical protein [Streptococcaceae bacterium]
MLTSFRLARKTSNQNSCKFLGIGGLKLVLSHNRRDGAKGLSVPFNPASSKFKINGVTTIKEANEFLKSYINRFNEQFGLISA